MEGPVRGAAPVSPTWSHRDREVLHRAQLLIHVKHTSKHRRTDLRRCRRRVVIGFRSASPSRQWRPSPTRLERPDALRTVP
jgi:hypothetical protein